MDMQKKIYSRNLVAVLLVLLMLFLVGCSHQPAKPAENTLDSAQDTKPTTDPTTDVATTPATEDPSEIAAASLNSLRQAMVETSQLFAVAYLGYHNSLPVDPFEAMRENMPQLCEDLPFLLEIPAERVIEEGGDLFCIIPLDEDATVAVSRGCWDDENQQCIYDDMIYSSNTGEPILLFCNNAGWDPVAQVYISGPSGEVFWYPRIDSNGFATEGNFYDISPYGELLKAHHRWLKDSDWTLPTYDQLIGTWSSNFYFEDGTEYTYEMSIQNDFLEVRWNDGEDHVYQDAAWELTYEEDCAVLTIDFGEMAGILRYNLLYEESYGELYVSVDVVQESFIIGAEPLSRYMTKTSIPAPVEMVGTWELGWTEVEGDIQGAEPGACIIEINSAASAGLLMSYYSTEFPNNNFENALLTIDEREMHYDCGNEEWVADVDYVGPWDTTYAITLTEDDILIKQNYYLVDGAPRVSYEYFRRVE